jgi:hypothetical protein
VDWLYWFFRLIGQVVPFAVITAIVANRHVTSVATLEGDLQGFGRRKKARSFSREPTYEGWALQTRCRARRHIRNPKLNALASGDDSGLRVPH